MPSKKIAGVPSLTSNAPEVLVVSFPVRRRTSVRPKHREFG
jgi:hypothetical protein